MQGEERLDVDSSQVAQPHQTCAALVWRALGAGKSETWDEDKRGKAPHRANTGCGLWETKRGSAEGCHRGDRDKQAQHGVQGNKTEPVLPQEPRGATQGHPLPAQHQGEGSASLTL